MISLRFTCDECGRERRGGDTHLCPLRECTAFTCMYCWDAHLMLHRLTESDYEARLVRVYYESQVRKIAEMRREEGLSLPGKLASDS